MMGDYREKTVTQLLVEERAAWEGRCKGLIESVHIRDKHIDELNHYIWELESKAKEAADAIEELISFDIRNLPEGLYTVKNGVVYTARVKVSGGNVLNLKTGESHWEDDRIVGGEQVFPKLPKKGKWSSRYDPEDKPFFRKKYYCSCCGEWNTYGMSDYCPNCGAEMERADEE